MLLVLCFVSVSFDISALIIDVSADYVIDLIYFKISTDFSIKKSMRIKNILTIQRIKKTKILIKSLKPQNKVTKRIINNLAKFQ